MIEWIQIPVLRDNYTVILRSEAPPWTAVIDPAESSPVRRELDDRGWGLDAIFNTHWHGDHVGGNLALKATYGAIIYGAQGEGEIIPGLDKDLWDTEQLTFSTIELRIFRVPGHTQRHLAFYFEDPGLLFAGDTLFGLGCGRLLGGTAEALWNSLDGLRRLPPSTLVFCAHEYTEANGRFAKTMEPDNLELQRRLEAVRLTREAGQATVPFPLAGELQANPFLRPESPSIRRVLGISAVAPNAEVFRGLRLRKDVF